MADLQMTTDRPAVTEEGENVPAGTTVVYLGHVAGGMVKVRFDDETVGVMHPHCFKELR